MLSALIPSAGRQPAMLLAEQLAHESCVRPGPLVLGTAPLKSPPPTVDRDRTVSRMVAPHCCGHRLYLPPLSRGRRVMERIDSLTIQELRPSSSRAAKRVVTGTKRPLLRRCCSTSAAEIRFFFE